MKAQMLKIAGVKTDKEFYKLFPDEESFMKKHGKAFKKAQMGAFIGGEKTTNPQMMNFNQFYDQADKNVTGQTDDMRLDRAYKSSQVNPLQPKQSGMLGNISQMLPMLKDLGVEAEYGMEIPKAQFGNNFAPNNKGFYQQPNTSFNNRPQVSNIQTTIQDSNTMAGTGKPLGVNIPEGPGIMDTVGKFMGPAGKLIEGFQALKGEKEDLQGAKQWRDVSAVSLQASRTRPEETERRYTRPEDIENTGEEFFPIYGVGTNVLAKDGAQIQNTYAPGTLYDDLEYDKLAGGGGIPFDWNAASQVGTGLTRNLTGNNAGATIGEGVGDLVGMIPGVGPVADAIITPVATAIGGLLDRNPSKIKKAQAATTRNMTSMSAGAMGQGLQQQYQGYMRTGGNIRQNNMDELQVYEGEAEQISTNPYLPDGGETVMFRGPSHADGGMDISYGNSPVEVEGGEPAVKLQDGGSAGENLVVYGNLPIPKGMLEDPDAKNKKFKNYANILSKKEASQNKLVDKTTKNLEDFKPLTSFDKIKMNSYDANLMGANMKLKDLAEKKKDAAALQNAINDTAKEHGIIAEDLAKGKYKVDRKAINTQAKYGRSIPMADEGYVTTTDESTKTPANTITSKELPKYLNEGYVADPNVKGRYVKAGKPSITTEPTKGKLIKEAQAAVPGKKYIPVENDWWKSLTPEQKAAHNVKRRAQIASDPQYTGTSAIEAEYETLTPGVTTPGFPEKDIYVEDKTSNPNNKIPEKGVEPSKRSLLMDLYNQALPYLRPTDQEALDPNQLAGEMYSMMSNQLEPVQAQSYQPQLDVPYDISLQDQLNEITSQQRAAQKTIGYNPAAQSMLAGQAYGPKSKVLAEQFRANQAMKDKVYSQNRATMNDAQLKNLAIYDQQYGRQEQAKSNTKANTLAALSSMSDKYAKNKLENRTLGVYENMYNYRYDSKGRAINMNPLQQFMPGYGENSSAMSNAEKKAYLEDQLYDIRATEREQSAAEKKAKQPSLAISRNGSIIKALKTL